MPIRHAARAKPVLVVRRVEIKGCAGAVYQRFYGDNGDTAQEDAQAVLIQTIEAVRGLGLPAAA